MPIELEVPAYLILNEGQPHLEGLMRWHESQARLCRNKLKEDWNATDELFERLLALAMPYYEGHGCLNLVLEVIPLAVVARGKCAGFGVDHVMVHRLVIAISDFLRDKTGARPTDPAGLARSNNGRQSGKLNLTQRSREPCDAADNE